jgi:hypothetical protein
VTQVIEIKDGEDIVLSINGEAVGLVLFKGSYESETLDRNGKFTCREYVSAGISKTDGEWYRLESRGRMAVTTSYEFQDTNADKVAQALEAERANA